jgi:hypothetical protein
MIYEILASTGGVPASASVADYQSQVNTPLKLSRSDQFDAGQLRDLFTLSPAETAERARLNS